MTEIRFFVERGRVFLLIVNNKKPANGSLICLFNEVIKTKIFMNLPQKIANIVLCKR